MQRRPIMTAVSILIAAVCAGSDQPEASRPAASDKRFLLTYPNLADPDGEVLFENEIVVVQRFVVGAGEWEGVHSHPGNQVYVHVKGGQWSGITGGSEPTLSGPPDEDGSVGWMDAIPLSEGHQSGNTGETPIDLIWVTLKEDAATAADADDAGQFYPHIPLELLLENDRVIVQRVQVEPGEWEGVHSHPGNQLYIHIKGGVWSERRGGEQLAPSPFSEPGSVGWMGAVDLSEGHESGNTGNTTIDLIWVTFK